MADIVKRAYNSFKVSENSGLIVKSSKNERLADEIDYYRNIPTELEIYFPRIFNNWMLDGEHFVQMELYAYKNLAHYMLFANHERYFWLKIFERLDNILQKFRTYKFTGVTETYAEAMYIKKTETEYAKLLKIPFFSTLANFEKIEVNGKQLMNFNSLWPKVRDYIIRSLPGVSFNIIHGDLCFSNILCGLNDQYCVLKLIDPRGSFGEKWCYGDPYYDYAKIAHSVDGGYEFLIYDQFNLQELDTGRFTFNLNGTGNQIPAQVFYDGLTSDIDKLKVQTIQGTIFIGMCARHYDSIERQKAMYLTGLRILNEVYEQI